MCWRDRWPENKAPLDNYTPSARTRGRPQANGRKRDDAQRAACLPAIPGNSFVRAIRLSSTRSPAKRGPAQRLPGLWSRAPAVYGRAFVRSGTWAVARGDGSVRVWASLTSVHVRGVAGRLCRAIHILAPSRARTRVSWSPPGSRRGSGVLEFSSRTVGCDFGMAHCSAAYITSRIDAR